VFADHEAKARGASHSDALKQKSADGYGAPTVIETIPVVPNESITWACYDPSEWTKYGIWFIEFALEGDDGRTKFLYTSYGWTHGLGDSDVEDSAFRSEVIERVRKIHEVLKEYVESETPVAATDNATR
jgi:hypothetical protein